MTTERSDTPEDLYNDFGTWILEYARMLDPAIAEDAVQEAFTAYTKRYNQPPPIKNPRGYIVTCTQNSIRKLSRRRKWIPFSFRAHVDRYEDPDVAKALAKLTTQQQTCLALRYGHDETVPSIAHHLGISESAVKTHITRGIAKLRAELGATHGS